MRTGVGVSRWASGRHGCQQHRPGAKVRRHAPDQLAGQPGHHVDPRGGHQLAVGPMMGVFNNLVLFDQSVKQASLQSIVPDLATSWAWSEDGTRLTFQLRQGVKWHDGQPFTAKDVVCTFDLRTGKAPEKLRLNPGL